MGAEDTWFHFIHFWGSVLCILGYHGRQLLGIVPKVRLFDVVIYEIEQEVSGKLIKHILAENI